MKTLNLSIFVIIVLACALLASACNVSSITPSSTTLENVALSSSTTIPALSATATHSERPPSPLVSVEASFPDGAPSLNQTARLIAVVKTPGRAANGINVEISLPEAFQLVNGELAWKGDVTKGVEQTVISAMVKSVKTGRWKIDLTSHFDPSTNGGYGGTGHNPIYVLVAENSAEWRRYPPYPDPEAPTLPAGQVPIMRIDKWGTIKTELTISHAPRLNETAELLITVVSPTDFPDLSLGILIHPKSALLSDRDSKLTPVKLVPGAEQLSMRVNGIDLQADIPYQFSATVVFEENGYYSVTAGAQRKVDNVTHIGQQSTVYLKIGADQSTFEKEPPPETTTPPVPPPATHA